MFRDYTNYDVLLDGRIWNKKRKKFLKPSTVRGGYQQVCLVDNEGKRHLQYVHRVCWMAVNGVWEIPKNYDIHHCDEDKMNNHITNLLLCTRKENINFGSHNERVAKAMKGNTNSPQKRVGAFKNDELVMCFPSINEARRQGFNQGNVWACCNGKQKTHKGLIWKYLEE